MAVTNAELSAVGRRLGHALALLPARHKRYKVECSCGYKSLTRTSERMALEAARHHLWLVFRAARADGVSLPSDRALGL